MTPQPLDPKEASAMERAKRISSIVALGIVGIFLFIFAFGTLLPSDRRGESDSVEPVLSEGEDLTSPSVEPPKIEVEPTIDVEFSDIVTSPGQYLGSILTLQGRVLKVISPAVFVLTDLAAESGVGMLVVLQQHTNDEVEESGAEEGTEPNSQKSSSIISAQKLQVTGRILRTSRDLLKDAAGLTGEEAQQWEHRPLLTQAVITPLNDLTE